MSALGSLSQNGPPEPIRHPLFCTFSYAYRPHCRRRSQPDSRRTLWVTGETLHQWRTSGGVIEVPTSDLRPALQAAYDPNMPDWPALLDWDDEAGSFHIA